MCPPEPQNVPSFGNRVFADGIKVKTEMTSYWVGGPSIQRVVTGDGRGHRVHMMTEQRWEGGVPRRLRRLGFVAGQPLPQVTDMAVPPPTHTPHDRTSLTRGAGRPRGDRGRGHSPPHTRGRRCSAGGAVLSLPISAESRERMCMVRAFSLGGRTRPPALSRREGTPAND